MFDTHFGSLYGLIPRNPQSADNSELTAQGIGIRTQSKAESAQDLAGRGFNFHLEMPTPNRPCLSDLTPGKQQWLAVTLPTRLE